MFLVLVRSVLCRGLRVRLLLVLVVNTVPHSVSSLGTCPLVPCIIYQQFSFTTNYAYPQVHSERGTSHAHHCGYMFVGGAPKVVAFARGLFYPVIPNIPLDIH